MNKDLDKTLFDILIVTLVFIYPVSSFINNYLSLFNNTYVFLALPNSILFFLAGIFFITKKPYAYKFLKLILIIGFVVYFLNLTTLITDMINGHFNFFYLTSLIFCILCYNYIEKSDIIKKFKELNYNYKNFYLPILAIIYSILIPIYGFFFALISLNTIIKLKDKKIPFIYILISIFALFISIIIIPILYFLR